MGRVLKVFLLILLGIFVIIQFIPSGRPLNEPPGDYDFFAANQVPGEVEKIIRNSCFDCHSQEVRYPWYAYVAPSSWLVSRDVKEARGHLDFSRWFELSKKDKLKLAGEIGEEVDEGSMPMPVYVLMHAEASLDRQQRDLILNWTETLAENIFEE